MANSNSQGKLLCVLGLGFGWAVTIGGTVGMGILRTPGEVAGHLPDPRWFLGLWIAGGLYALFGTIAVAELAATFPRSGGPFLLTRHVLGRYPGFVVGWSDWLNWSASCAALALVLGEYTVKLIPAWETKDRWIGLLFLLGMLLLQLRGVRTGSQLQEWTSLIKAIAFLVLIACCFTLGSRLPAHDVSDRSVPTNFALLQAIIIALQSVMFTYGGWEITTYFGEEVRDPGRTIPRSMIGSTLMVFGLYVLFNLALLFVLSLPEMAGDILPVSTAAEKLFGTWGGTIVSVLAIVNLAAALLSAVLLTPRILYALARERLAIPQAAQVNSGGTPDIALVLTGLTCVLFLISGTFDELLAIMAFIVVVNYGMLFTGVFVCRWREPDLERPYRAWGYPWTPALALIGSVLFLIGAVVADFWNSLYALALWAISGPVYLIVRRFGH